MVFPRFIKYLSLCAYALIVCTNISFAQAQAQGQSQPQPLQLLFKPKSPARQEIDGKRIGTNMNSEDALPRSREFKRTDSTYYVGWLYEGAYKYNHAADYLGYKNASVPLERALRLIERDYRKELATRTSDLITYFPVYHYQIDYTTIALYLMNCYANMEQADMTYALLRRVLKWNFQRDYMMDAYNYLGWTIHRNRYYTSTKYPFLKNSIDDNERLANKYLDSGLRRININKNLNSKIFQPGYENMERLSVYHYKSMLYSYSLKIDSAAYYYGLLRNSPLFPHNNYATFRMVCGDFKEAEKEYKLAVTQDVADKRLKEWAYYSSILDIYKSKPKIGTELMQNMIRANGSTPGFGWYNIAAGRCMYYDGQISDAERYADKAAEFKELHIGTTLTQAHYDFSIQLIKLMDKQAALERQKFEHADWWYNPNVLAGMSKILGEKYMQQFLIINQFAQNPERDRVIYKLFSTESTVSWDEVWALIKDFSTRYFTDRFKKEYQTDDRKYVRKYFKLFIAKLEMQLKNYSEAKRMLDELVRDETIDKDYEKLFLARVYEAEARCAAERKDNRAYAEWMYRFYITYPQLVPSSGLQMSMSLHIGGRADEQVVKRLKDCNITWSSGNSTAAANAYIVFGDKKRIEYYVLDNAGNYIVDKQAFTAPKADKAGVDLAYRLFNIGGKLPDADKDND